MKLILSVVILMSALCVSATRASTAPAGRHLASRHGRHRHVKRARFRARKRKTTATILHPAAPKPHEAVEESPPVLPPIVVYYDGLLAVTAQDAALGDILESVHASTGALVDAPVLKEHVSVLLMPQAPVQIIASLLEGMNLNYVMVGGTSDQDRLQHLVVSRRPTVAETPVAAGQADRNGDARVSAAARFAEETGGDEGVWENGPQLSPEAGAPSSPAGVSARE